MLNPDQLEQLGNTVQAMFDPVSDFLLKEIARRVAQAGQLTSTASYEVWKLQTLGKSQEEIKKKLQKLLNVSKKELEELLTQSAEVGYNFDLSSLPTADALPFAENTAVQGIIQMIQNEVLVSVNNLTGTTAIGFDDASKKFHSLDEAIHKACDFAFQKVSSGAQDYGSAVRDATRQLANRGIMSFDYASGVKTEMGAAVRRNVMGSLGLMQEQIAEENHDALGANGWEISAHFASAPDHEPIQGKQYSDAEYKKLNESLVRRIGTLNCGHSAHPIILGVSEPQYTSAQLARMRNENDKGTYFNGEHFSTYEATQRQRAYERAIRKSKRRISVTESEMAVKGSPILQDQLQIDKTKLRLLNKEYRDFSKATGLRLQRERLWVPTK